MPEVEMYEATPEMAAYINEVCQHLVAESRGNYAGGVALAISVVSQTFILLGGDVSKREMFAEAVRKGVLMTLETYATFARVNHAGTTGRN